MNKLFTILMSIFLIGSCEKNTPVAPPSEPEPTGCEGADLYVWDDLTYSDILGENETTWLYFEVDELGYYSVLFNSGGFECDIFDKCNPDNMEFGDTLLISFISVEQQILDIGPVNPGDYFLKMHNTRNRAEFNFTIIVSDIVPGCTDYTAENYNPDANYDVGICEYVLVAGCMDELACNYNSLAEEDDGSCVLAEENYDCDGDCIAELDNCGICGGECTGECDCSCPSGIFDECNICDGPGAQHECWDESIVCSPAECTTPPVYGCMDEEALNYNEDATVDDGSCEYQVCPEDWTPDCNGNCAPDNWVGDGWCDDGTYSVTNPLTNETYPVNLMCEEFNFDEGDCDGGGRIHQSEPLPNGRILNAK